MGLILSAFLSHVTTQPSEKFGCHEEQGCSPELAKDTNACFQLSVNISLCKVQIHSIIILPLEYTRQKRSIGSVVGITSWSSNQDHQQTFLRNFYLSNFPLPWPNMPGLAWRQHIQKAKVQSEVGGCWDSHPASLHHSPQPQPIP